MAYVEAHAALREHPKTKRAARLLGVTPVAIVGHLLFLWWWCQDYAQDGNLSAWSAEEIAEAASWPGDPSAFVESLLNCGQPGFLEIDNEGALLVHDWLKYGGKLFKTRQQGAARQANWRARHSNGNVTPHQNVSNASVTRYVTQSNAYREDKTREDKTIEEEPVVAVDPAYGQAIRAFENDISLVSGSLAEDMSDTWDLLTANGTPDWWYKAIEVAVWANARSWRYMRGVLTKCLQEGHPPGYKRNNGHGPAPVADLADANEAAYTDDPQMIAWRQREKQ
jgi:hypothetical protein